MLHLPGERTWEIEIKRSLKPRAERCFHAACEDLGPEKRFLAYPGRESYPSKAGLEIVPVFELMQRLTEELR